MVLTAVLRRIERKLDSLLSSHSSLTGEVQELAERINAFENNLFEGVSDEENDEEIENYEDNTDSDTEENGNDSDRANALVPPGIDLTHMFPKEITGNTDNNDKKDHVWNIRSHTDRKKVYSVELIDGKEWICNCPAFIYRKSNKYECKHIKQVKRDEF